jgi:hypothetical protein
LNNDERLVVVVVVAVVEVVVVVVVVVAVAVKAVKEINGFLTAQVKKSYFRLKSF